MLKPMSRTGLAHNVSVFPGLRYRLFVVSKLHGVAYSQIYYIPLTTGTSYYSEVSTVHHPVSGITGTAVCLWSEQGWVLCVCCACLAVFIENVCGDRQVRQPCPIEQQRRRHRKKKKSLTNRAQWFQ